jgi:AcrR family transcriptional regulator
VNEAGGAAGGSSVRPDADASPTGRCRRRTSDVRAALVVAGSRVVERDGAAALTVRAVAVEAGVAPMGVYNHFRDKRGLVVAVLADAFDRLARATAWRADLTPRAALREVGLGYRRFALAHRNTYGLMFGEATSHAEALDQVGQHSDDTFDQLVHAVRICQQHRIIRDGDPLSLAMAFWSAVHGAVSLEVSGSTPPGTDAERAYDDVLDLLERGLAPSADT